MVDPLANDVALIGIEETATVTPMKVRTKPFDAAFVGLSVRIIGFGAVTAAANASFTKRSGASTIEVDRRERTTLLQGKICFGWRRGRLDR